VQRGEGFFLVYSIIDRSSFESIREWADRLLRVRGQDHVPFIIMGTKCDLEHERQVLVSGQSASISSKYYN
jgi:GTPase KRas protein